MSVLVYANLRSLERSVAIGTLGVRVVHYESEDAPPQRRPMPGLVVSLIDRRVPHAGYHQDAGVYGFLDLDAGPTRLLIRDPLKRYVERTVRFVVPDRTQMRAALATGADAGPSRLASVIHTVPLRPGPGFPVRSGQTSLWGVVRSPAGQPHPYARLEIDTRLVDGTATTIVTHADAAGGYAIVLTGERVAFTPPVPAAGGAPASPGTIVTRFPRSLRVHVLKRPAPPASAFTAFPDNFDTLNPDAAAGPYLPAAATLVHPTTGDSVTGSPLLVPVDIGKRQRWDVVAT